MPVDLSVFKSAAHYREFQSQDWDLLAERLREVRPSAGHMVFREKEPGDGFYFIRAGKVKISKQVVPEGKKTPQELLLAVLTAGSLFGEMALVDGTPRSADAVVEESAILFYLSQEEYEKLQKEHPSTALRIQDILVSTLCSRIREANRSFELIRYWCT
ncbi:MAG TPA: cyclic nucleotide-binding domain-containing protein [bacterium]|jgi:CRP/FNR family cyclic AMP-dependent transcriptional regulator|nr:cyclic nucleotide-binding domain-containing protein [bacterium]